jgi:chaperonin GroEL
MAANAGESPDLITDIILKGKKNTGYNFSNGETINMLEEGIIDPAKVARCALQNAASVSSTLITADHCVIESQ